MQEQLRVEVEGGKYTVVMDGDFRLYALRYGEQWRDCIGDNLILALAQEVQRLRTTADDLVADWNASVEEAAAEIGRLRKALADTALTALAAETQAQEAYQKQLAAEEWLWDEVMGEVVLPEAPAVDEQFWLDKQKEQQ